MKTSVTPAGGSGPAPAYIAIEDGERAPISNEYEVPACWREAATAQC